MTDPEFADATYAEPLTVESVTKIIEVEKPDALLPTLGGQTGLNLSLELFSQGVLEEHGIEMIGAKPEAIRRGRTESFSSRPCSISAWTPLIPFASIRLTRPARKSTTWGFSRYFASRLHAGGTGGGIAYNKVEFEEMLRQGFGCLSD